MKRIYFVVTVLAVLSLGMIGCTSLMPAEIRQMRKRTTAAASRLRQEMPSCFCDYEIGGQSIRYVEITDATPKPLVIFIHGSPGEWTGWVDYLDDHDLRARAHLIAVDRPGFGGSGNGQVERSLAAQSRAIAPLLDHASPGQRVILVGHSFGGPVAARMAMDYGSKITDLIFLAASIDPAQERTLWYQYPADWPPFTGLLPSELVVTNREIRALKDELTAMLPLWPRVTQRVTLIQGGKDPLVPPANADFAQRVLTHPDSFDLIRIPTANHFLPWNQTALVKSTLLRHLH